MRRFRRKRNNNLIIILFVLLVMLLTMSIGYSLFTDQLYIRGTANIKIAEISDYYTIIFDANGGSGTMSPQTMEIGKTGSLKANSFSKENYGFLYWNTEPDGSGITYTDKENVLNLSEIPGDTVTLYAFYDLETYSYNGDYVFDGNTYIDTGIKLFSEKNIHKNFEISFEIKERATANNQATLVSCMDESGEPWPGVVYRLNNGTEDQISANSNTSDRAEKNYSSSGIQKVIIQRISDKIYLTFNDSSREELIVDMTNFLRTFDVTTTFGASLNDVGNPQRYFTGTLSNMKIELFDNGSTISYDPNGGSGTMKPQVITTGESVTLCNNNYTRDGYIFTGWNTSPDGTGTQYANGQVISEIDHNNESFTLYAQWKKYEYSIVFNPNGGNGSATEQNFKSDQSQALNTNIFTKDGSNFLKWNTSPDGTGQDYDDGETVINVGKNDGEIVNLYAIWGTMQTYPDTVFDGTNYIDTGLQLFSEENKTKNFEISFNIDSDTSTEDLTTLVSLMDERGEPWPGIVFRRTTYNSNSNYEIQANIDTNNKVVKEYPINSTNSITISRLNNILYISTNGGEKQMIADYTSFTRVFDSSLTIGASLDGDGNPQRYFTGTLSNIKVLLIDN